MKIGIFYASKTGITKKCASILQESLEASELIDVRKGDYNISGFDFIIVGSPVRMKKLHKSITKFLKRNKEILYNKKVGYFVCNSFNNKYDDALKASLPSKLYNRALLKMSFGGEIDITKQKGFDKFISKIAIKMKGFKMPEIDNDAILKFSDEVKFIGLRWGG